MEHGAEEESSKIHSQISNIRRRVLNSSNIPHTQCPMPYALCPIYIYLLPASTAL
ncbi:hypothetical protein [Nostoc linckia]|uniref:hypothetical protein n=1 Tax=Nostoc linckia TaxID=92942 RepID=UPI0015D52320|nr:hypothetical protein [Nostoc linckia]